MNLRWTYGLWAFLAVALLMAGPGIHQSAQATGMADPAGTKGDCDLSQPIPAALYPALLKAHQLYDKGEYQKALDQLEKLKKGTRQNHYRLFFMRGLLNYQLHHPAEAEKNLVRALEIKPCFFQAAYNLAAVLFEQGKFSLAAKSALKAFELSRPVDWEILYLAGVAFLSADQPAQAEKHLARLAVRRDSKPEWRQALIRSLVEQNKRQAAKEQINRFLDRWPDSASMWRLMASLEAADQRYGPAAAALEVVLELEDGPSETRLQLAQLYRAAGAPLRAAEHFSLLYGPAPQPEESEELAKLYYQGCRFELARQMLLKSIALEPTAARYGMLADINLQLRDYPAARQAFTQASKSLAGPAAGRQIIRAARCALHLGDYIGAEADYSRALKLAGPEKDLIREAREGLKLSRDLAAYWRESR